MKGVDKDKEEDEDEGEKEKEKEKAMLKDARCKKNEPYNTQPSPQYDSTRG